MKVGFGGMFRIKGSSNQRDAAAVLTERSIQRYCAETPAIFNIHDDCDQVFAQGLKRKGFDLDTIPYTQSGKFTRQKASVLLDGRP